MFHLSRMSYYLTLDAKPKNYENKITYFSICSSCNANGWHKLSHRTGNSSS